MLQSAKSAVRSKAAAVAVRLADAVDRIGETLRAALGLVPVPVPIRVRARQPHRPN